MMPFFTVKLSTKKMRHYLNDNTWDFCSQMFGNKMG